MNTLEYRTLFLTLSWKWTIVSFCFLVLFHLVPTYLIVSPGLMFRDWQFIEVVAWIGMGIAPVSIYVGMRSHNPRILEPAIAAIVYCLSMGWFLRAQDGAPNSIFQTRYVVAMTVVAFVVGFASAGFTAILRMRKEAKAAT